MVDDFIQVFGEMRVGNAVMVIAAIVFLVKIYKIVANHFKEKYEREAEKEKQIQDILEQAKKYPEWRGQSINAQERFDAAIESLNEKIDRISKSVTELYMASGEGMAYTWRYRILRFDDEIRHDKKHTKEHFDQILEDITDYENYCREHPKFPNNKVKFAVKNIKNVYQKCTDEGTFL